MPDCIFNLTVLKKCQEIMTKHQNTYVYNFEKRKNKPWVFHDYTNNEINSNTLFESVTTSI